MIGSNQRLFLRLIEFGLVESKASVFLDIGSGMGIPALHFSALYDCLSLGIEIEYPLWLVSHANIKRVYKRAQEEGKILPQVSFLLSSVLELQTFDGIDIIYSFDKLFGDELLMGIAEIFNRSSSKVLISYHNLSRLTSLGFKDLALQGCQTMEMVGSKEGKTAFIYTCRRKGAISIRSNEVDPIFKDTFIHFKNGTLVEKNKEMNVAELCPPRATRKRKNDNN